MDVQGLVNTTGAMPTASPLMGVVGNIFKLFGNMTHLVVPPPNIHPTRIQIVDFLYFYPILILQQF